MENMFYAEELVREFLVFRGFTSTLQVYQTELSTDIGKGFDVDKILDLVFLVYVPKFQAEKLVSLLRFFKQYVSTTTETILVSTLSKLEASILRYYIVQAIQSGKKDKVVEFLGASGNDLLQQGQDWGPWFAIPYLKNPSLDPQFRIYFSKEWYDALRLSFRNFLSEIFSGARIPSLLKISTEKNTVKRLKKDIKQLNLKLSQLQALLEEKEAQISHYRSKTPALEGMLLQKSSSIDHPVATMGKGADVDYNLRSKGIDEGGSSPSSSRLGGEAQQTQDKDTSGSSKLSTGLAVSQLVSDSSSLAKISSGGSGNRSTYQMFEEYYYSVGNGEVQREEEFPEVKVEFQETFLGHTSPISKCRFSASGTNIASASTDGTVRIWTYDSSVPTSRNAAIYCGAEIMSLDWECKSDRLLLIGTASGGIKAWNVDAKRVVCDLNTTQAFPSVLDLKCSPVEPIFVSAAASRGETNKAFCGFLDQSEQYQKCFLVDGLGKDHIDQVPKVHNHAEFVDQDHPERFRESPSTTTEEAEEASGVEITGNAGGEYSNNFDRRDTVGIVTGNWGCGAFGGDIELKVIIRWLAASQVPVI